MLPYIFSLRHDGAAKIKIKTLYQRKQNRGVNERYAWQLRILSWITDSLALPHVCTHQHEGSTQRVSGSVVMSLVWYYLLPFPKRCHLCSSALWFILFTVEILKTEILKCENVLLPSGRACVSTRCHWRAELNTCIVDIIKVSRHSVMSACALWVCPPILTESLNTPPILSSQPLSQ